MTRQESELAMEVFKEAEGIKRESIANLDRWRLDSITIDRLKRERDELRSAIYDIYSVATSAVNNRNITYETRLAECAIIAEANLPPGVNTQKSTAAPLPSLRPAPGGDLP